MLILQERLPPDLYEKQFTTNNQQNNCVLITALGQELENLRQELLQKKKGDQHLIIVFSKIYSRKFSGYWTIKQ